MVRWGLVLQRSWATGFFDSLWSTSVSVGLFDILTFDISTCYDDRRRKEGIADLVTGLLESSWRRIHGIARIVGESLAFGAPSWFSQWRRLESRYLLLQHHHIATSFAVGGCLYSPMQDRIWRLPAMRLCVVQQLRTQTATSATHPSGWDLQSIGCLEQSQVCSSSRL